MDSERRYARLLVTPDFIIKMLKPGKHVFEIVKDGLPDDAHVVWAGKNPLHDYDPEMGCLSITIESEFFRTVPIGRTIPILPGPWLKEDVTAHSEYIPSCKNCAGAMTHDESNSSATQKVFRCPPCGMVDVVDVDQPEPGAESAS